MFYIYVGGLKVKNFIQKIFSVKNEGKHKIWTILGIKMKFKRKVKQNNIELICSDANKNRIIPESPEDYELNIEDAGLGSSFLKPIINSALKTQITTLDKFVEENNLQVGLIKVDIEGFEQEFLKGAMNTIKTQKPVLLLSIYHNLSDYLNIKPIIEDLSLGYKFKIRRAYDLDLVRDTMLICEVVGA